LNGGTVAKTTEQEAVKAEEKSPVKVEKPVVAEKKSSVKMTAKVVEKAKAQPVVSIEELAAQGKSVYEKNCASCHSPDGTGMAGIFPALKGSSVVKGDIKDQADLMLKGKGMMPAFNQVLNSADFAAVVTYTRNGLGNAVGDSLQPAEVQSLQSAQK
jgi:cytochrome c oxidase subunit 2